MPDFLDPYVIGRIKSYELRSHRLVESYMAGMHKSRLLGISTEFAQHRQYVPGDDTRHLDWRVFAKTDRYFVKQYEAETNMPVFFLLDTSNSMFFQSPGAPMSKYEYAATTVATLAYLLMLQKDTFGLVLFDERVRTTMSAKGSHAHFRNMMELLQAAAPGEKTNVGNALAALAPQLKRRGLVVLISDMIDDTGRLALGLGQLSFGHHDLVLFHVEDPVERDFPFSGQTIFLGPEREGRLLCEPRDLRRAYVAARDRHLAGIRQSCLRFGFEMEQMPTDQRLDVALSKFLALRQVRRKRR